MMEELTGMCKELFDEMQSRKRALREAMITHGNLAKDLVKNKTKLEKAKAQKLIEGVEGKNAEIRAANLQEMLKIEYQDVETSERLEREARLEVELTQLDFDEMRYLVRICELAVK